MDGEQGTKHDIPVHSTDQSLGLGRRPADQQHDQQHHRWLTKRFLIALDCRIVALIAVDCLEKKKKKWKTAFISTNDRRCCQIVIIGTVNPSPTQFTQN